MDFPRLDSADIIGVDIETRDPEIKAKGNGVCRPDTYIVGLAVATRDAAWYFPVRHENGENLDRGQVYAWANRELSTPIPKVGTNLQYDTTFLWDEGVNVQGPFYDIQNAEALIDENQFSYSLDTQAVKYLGHGKNEEAMLEYVRQHFKPSKGKEKSHIWQCPPEIVAAYARSDAQDPIFILDRQLEELRRQELMEVWQLETDLLPIMGRMHLHGCRVDVALAEQLYEEWGLEIVRLEAQSQGLNARSSKQIAAMLDELGIEYPRHKPTAKMKEKGILIGNPNLDASVLKDLADQVPVLACLRDIKSFGTYRETFVKGGVINNNINGRIHATFNQLKGDEYGTVSGRTSTSKPNIANIPNPERNPYFAAKCRALFLPEPGQQWLRFDLSQFEYRLLVHYANFIEDSGADIAVRMYREDPETDFHQMCADLMSIKRKPAKSINFGISFGMGKDKLSKSLGVSQEEGLRLLELYHQRVPFVKKLSDKCIEVAKSRGYMKTLSGRRARFHLWEPDRFGHDEKAVADEGKAREQWGRIKRAGTHKALNRITQGGNGDWIKKAMVEGVKSGVTDVLGMYLNTIYDEVAFSIESGKPEHEEAATEMKRIFASAYKLSVPVLVSEGRGANWAEAS
jgi:DNA polymerase I-like protein with 3'-5' exonuclease and polymerase domains